MSSSKFTAPVWSLVAGLGCGVPLLLMTGCTVGVIMGSGSSDRPDPEPSTSPSEAASESPSEEPSEVVDEEEDPVVEDDPVIEETDISDFVGAATVSGPFEVEVIEAYISDSVSDDLGFSETAPGGTEFHVFYVEVTNTGSSPEWYAFENYADTDSGNSYMSHTDAEIAVYDAATDFWAGELNPNTTSYTYHVFAIPEGESVTEVRLLDGGSLVPVE